MRVQYVQNKWKTSRPSNATVLQHAWRSRAWCAAALPKAAALPISDPFPGVPHAAGGNRLPEPQLLARLWRKRRRCIAGECCRPCADMQAGLRLQLERRRHAVTAKRRGRESKTCKCAMHGVARARRTACSAKPGMAQACHILQR